jgi:plasmid stabilization system protein ParE
VRVRFTLTERRQFLAALAHIRRDNPAAAVRFRQRTEEILRRLEQFPASGRGTQSFPNSPTGRSSSHHTDFFTVSKTKRYGWSPSGMARSYLENLAQDRVQDVQILNEVLIGERRGWGSAQNFVPLSPSHESLAVKEAMCGNGERLRSCLDNLRRGGPIRRTDHAGNLL